MTAGNPTSRMASRAALISCERVDERAAGMDQSYVRMHREAEYGAAPRPLRVGPAPTLGGATSLPRLRWTRKLVPWRCG